MASPRHTRASDKGKMQEILSTAAGAAEALSVGAVRLTEKTLIEAVHAVEDIGNVLGATVVRAARGSIKAAEDIGGDLVMVGKGVSRGVTEPARQVGSGVARLAAGLWSGGARVRRRRRPKTDERARKPPAKASGRRRRRSAA